MRLFARLSFDEVTVGDIADAAEMTPAAVYYHFAGKEDLYGAAIAKVLHQIDEIVARIRADDAPAESDTLDRIIDAVWDWVDENPDPAKLVHLHTPAATRQAAQLRREFDELHVRRAFAYLEDSADAATTAPQRLAVATLALRTLVDVSIAIHPMRMPGGPLSGCSPKTLRRSMKEISARLIRSV